MLLIKPSDKSARFNDLLLRKGRRGKTLFRYSDEDVVSGETIYGADQGEVASANPRVLAPLL
jgi:hypothetical protein